MFFTQGRGFVVGASFGLQIRPLRCRVLVCHAADTASLATWFLFGKLIGVATLFDFGEKRCRKKLPLCDSRCALRLPCKICLCLLAYIELMQRLGKTEVQNEIDF